MIKVMTSEIGPDLFGIFCSPKSQIPNLQNMQKRFYFRPSRLRCFNQNIEVCIHLYICVLKILFGIHTIAVFFIDRDHFQLGSMSHFLNVRAAEYQDLPDYPTEAPDPTVRNVELPPSSTTAEALNFDLGAELITKTKKKGKKDRSFYSDSGESDKSGSESESGSGSGSGSESESGSGTEDSESDSEDSGSGSEEEETGSESSDDEDAKSKTKKKQIDKATSNGINDKTSKKKPRKVVRYSRKDDVSNSEEEEEDESSNDNSHSGSESDSESEDDRKPNNKVDANANHTQSSKVDGGEKKEDDASTSSAAEIGPTGDSENLLKELDDLGNGNGNGIMKSDEVKPSIQLEDSLIQQPTNDKV